MATKIIQRFHDVQAHALAVSKWNQTYSQLSAGPLDSSLVQITGERSHIFREHINQRVVQQGAAPSERVCFAIPLAVPGPIKVQGRAADESCLFYLRGEEEFMFHMPTGMDLFSITFERDFFELALQQIPSAGDLQAVLRQPVIRVPPRRLAECRQYLLSLFVDVVNREHLDGRLTREVEQAMLTELLTLLAYPEIGRQPRIQPSRYSFIVERCHNFTLSRANDAPSVSELCERLKVSRRTVQTSFRMVTDMTPLHYLRSLRLNGVRRALMSTCASELSVGDAASQWGFFHMSHFAEEYEQLFGLLPAHTPRAKETGGLREVTPRKGWVGTPHER